jgi:peptidoglycan/LPS O-acetylase OafA/YrhL
MTNERSIIIDGWRGISILLVLAAHLLPLGPKNWKFNETAGLLGMSIFFILSGFLITSYFSKSLDVKKFAIRRLSKILPLAWLGLAYAYVFHGLSFAEFVGTLLFFANWPPMLLTDVTAHYWSLCVEVQFYFLIAILVYLFKEKFVYFVVFLCISVTIHRIANGVYAAINTYYRVDEILSGSVLAILINHKRVGNKVRMHLAKINPAFMTVLLILSCSNLGGFLNYLRPYFAALLIGATVCGGGVKIRNFLENSILLYLAGISYALYIIHPFLADTWLGAGDVWVKYAKRPIFFLFLFPLAHGLTNYFEKFFVERGREYTGEGYLREN